MRMYSTLDWVNAQNAGPVSELHLHRGLWEAVDSDIAPMSTPYAAWMLKRHDVQTVESAITRREAAYRALVAGEPLEPMPCTLGPTGHFELLDGHHRASAAVHLGLEMVPLDVQAVSPLWQVMTDNLGSIYQGRERYLYQSIEHPWFSGWDTSRSDERLDIVERALSEVQRGDMPHGNLLDVGSCTGRICRLASRAGWRVFGVERDQTVCSVAEYLDIVMGTKCSYLQAPLDSDPARLLVLKAPKWACTVALSVFHAYHTLGQAEWAGRWLRDIIRRSHAVITDCDQPGRVYQGHTAVSEPEYRAWLQSLAPNRKIEPIGCTEGRTIYLVR